MDRNPFSAAFAPLVATVTDGAFATDVALRSPLHGPPHWRGVAEVGRLLAQDGSGCDLAVVLAFALLHDTQRLNDSIDPFHGHRAADAMRAAPVPLGDAQLDVLAVALEGHNGGSVSGDPTVGTCWDADRLTLPRVGIRVDPRLLSTDQARAPERIAAVGRALAADGEVGSFAEAAGEARWREVLRRYDAC